MDQILRVNVSRGTIAAEPLPESWRELGGRGLVARIAMDEIPPDCHPLGPHNKLIFTVGLLAATPLPCSGRLSAGGKSPLTGGIKESNAGGILAAKLARLGFRALVVEGDSRCLAPDVPELNSGTSGHGEGGEGGGPGRWQVLYISRDRLELRPAGDLAGLGVYAAAAKLRDAFGPKAALALVGPAGEGRLPAAGIATLDKDGSPSRYCARGGMGAVMGAKGLKAIVVDEAGGANLPLAHREAFRAAMGRYTEILQTNPQTSQVYTFYGTAAMVSMANTYGGLPTCNFSSGQFPGAEAISGERLHDLILERGGEGDLTHACMPGCVIKCSNVFAGPDGKVIVSPLEYETIGLLGSNLGLADLDAIARLNWLCNDVGLDTIEIGAALAVAAEAGVLDFGDAVAAARIIEEAREGTPPGRLVGSGAMAVGRAFGNIRVPAVKGQAMSAYEPRAVKGTGVTYATSPQGADHTAGLTIRAKIDHLKPEGQAALSKKTQVNVAAFDTMGLCLFVTPAVGWEHQVMVDLLNARFGSRRPPEYITELGRQVLGLELEFNRRAGFLPLDDRLPEFMAQEALPPHQVVFDVSGEDLAGVFEDLRGQVNGFRNSKFEIRLPP